MTILTHLMSLIGYVVPFLFVLGLVVFIHEFGHFQVGRWCGVKVDAFSLGFGPELAHFIDRKGTRWRIGALPLGGYVKFHGDASVAGGADAGRIAVMPAAERRISFFHQKVWKRAAIVAAGPIANFILAIVIFTGIFTVYGHGVQVPRVDQVMPGEAAATAGFRHGDFVQSINGRPVADWNDMTRVVQESAGEPLTFVVTRDGAPVTLTATPQLRETESLVGKVRVARLGISASNDPQDYSIVPQNLASASALAVHETWFVAQRTVTYVVGLFAGRESPDQISGPIGTGRIAGEVAKLGFGALLNLAAVLSVSIGLINLVPIPLLDGGHLFYYAFEFIRGRPLSLRIQEYGFRVGLALVGALMIFATVNDILHLTGS